MKNKYQKGAIATTVWTYLETEDLTPDEIEEILRIVTHYFGLKKEK